MAKKVGVTVPDAVFDIIEKKAESQGRTPTGLAAFLLEYCVVNDIGFVESVSLDCEPISSKFLKALVKGQSFRNGELIRLAHHLDIPVEVLLVIRDTFNGLKNNAENTTERLGNEDRSAAMDL